MDLILAIEHWPLRQAIVALYRRQFTIISLPDAVPFSPRILSVLQRTGSLLVTDRQRNHLLQTVERVRRHSLTPVIIINRRESYLTQLIARFFNNAHALSYDGFYRHIQRRTFHPLDLYFLPYSRGAPDACWGAGETVHARLNAFGLMTLYQRGVTLREAAVLLSLSYHNSTAMTARLLGIHEQAVVYCKRTLGNKLGLDHNRPDFISHIFLSPGARQGARATE
ncbi:hypothetical protein [Edwardsiella piscicida]|uniref:hypothetical protein n=1 Tax=Edwardsiella piscicida TaxID=1263550 RepID=UPI00370DCB54